MLTLVEDRLPDSSTEWDELAGVYNQRRSTGTLAAIGAGLKRHFNLYANIRKPTGDPTRLEKVRKVKRARWNTQMKVDTEKDDDDPQELLVIDSSQSVFQQTSLAGMGNETDTEPSPPLTQFSFPSVASVAEESLSEIVQTTLNNVEDREDIGNGSEGLESHEDFERKAISCAPITTTCSTSNASATPNRQTGLTPQMSVSARRRINLDKAIMQIIRADSDAMRTVANVSPMHEMMMAQLRNDSAQGRTDEHRWESEYARRDVEIRDEWVRYETEREDRRRRDEDEREE